VTAVRFLGTVHDFVMLNALAASPAAKGAIALATELLRSTLSEQNARALPLKEIHS
jgi:acetyl esterase